MSHWQLDRKLRELLGRLGIDGESAWHGVEIMKTLLVRVKPDTPAVMKKTKSPPAKKALKELAQNILLENYSADDFRNVLGINVFDDVTWFNKEAFERVLFFAPVFAAMETGNFALVKSIADEFSKAEAKAGYRLGGLIEAFNPS